MRATSRISAADTVVPLKRESSARASSGLLSRSSYLIVFSWPVGRLWCSLAARRTHQRQRSAHRAAGDNLGHSSRSSSVSMPKNGLGNSVSTFTKLGRNQDMTTGSASMLVTTSWPSLMTWMIRASGNA